MFWPITATIATALCLLLLYRNRRLKRSVAIRDKALKSPGWERRSEEFFKSEGE